MQLEQKRKKPVSLFNDVSPRKDTKRDHTDSKLDLSSSKGQNKFSNDLSTIFTLLDQQKSKS